MKNTKHIQQPNKNSGLFGYLLLLTVFFIFLEITVLVQCNEIYFTDYKLVAEHIKIPVKIIPGILFFLFVQFGLHLLFTVMVWAMARLIAVAIHCSWRTTEKIGFGLWFLGIGLILLANQSIFPNSKFAHLVGALIPGKVGGIFLFISLAIFIVALGCASLGFFKRAPRLFASVVGVVVASIAIGYSWSTSDITDAGTAEKPNIIIIGIDSLRPDFLGYFGYEKQTPHIDNFLNQSMVFADAFTPLARTFPAWVSILSGEYPKHSGLRFNLPPLQQFDWSHNLPSTLRQLGYQTIFSTDEVRFSNIDKSFGFDKTLTPPMGVNDFLLGNLNDFPMANLIINTPLGKYLFPHSYGNRPVSVTYNPDAYLSMLKSTLMQPRTNPLFFAIHFCLPHMPYFWGKQAVDDKSIHNYQASIKRVDEQFFDFMQMLQQANLLKHSIIILMSDHGEAIELPGDRVTEADLFVPGVDNPKKTVPQFFPPAFDFEEVNQSVGHGTDVLGLTQSHIVLAIRTIGLTPNSIGNTTIRASLLDLKPTLLDFLHINENNHDGHSLKDIILGLQTDAKPKHFFMESDFSPQAVRSVHPEARKLLFEGIEYFQIDPETSRITVKPSMIKLIVSSKQFADIYGEWILALYPQNKTEMMPILVNLKTGYWTNDLRTSFAKESPAENMLASLKQFYGADITQVINSGN